MSQISRRDFLKVSGTVLAGAALTACGQQVATTVAPPPVAEQPTDTAAAPAPVEAATNTPEAAAPAPEATATTAPVTRTWPPPENVAREKTLIYSYGNVVQLCSPWTTGWNHQDGYALLTEPCAYYATHADKTYMWLAESYKMSTDAKEFTITFRKGIEWSDGTPFTAKDPVFAMTKLKTVKGINRAATYATELDKAEAVDDLTLKVTLNTADYRFFFKSLTFRYDLGDDSAIVPEHIYKDIPEDQYISFKFYDPAKGWPVTTGPYGVSSSTDQLTNFDLHPTWWAVKTGFMEKYPDVERLVAMPYQNDTLGIQQVINNEVDQTLDIRPMIMTALLAQTDHVTTWTEGKPPYGYTDWWPISVQVCTAKPPFDNPKVRWAIAYAINQQQVMDVAWVGAGQATPYIYPLFKHLTTYLDSLKDILDKHNPLEFNLDKSAQLMTEAGFTKNKDGWWADKDGKVPDSNLYAAVPLFADLAPVIAEQLRTAGFQCEHKAPQDVWAAKVDGRASLFLFGHGGSTYDPYDTFMLYRKENVLPMGQQSWGNITRWSDPEFTKITDTMNGTPMDDPKVMDLFHQGMTIWYDALPDIPLCQWYHRIPMNNTYWTNWPTEANPYINSAIWHQTALLVVNGLKSTGKTA